MHFEGGSKTFLQIIFPIADHFLKERREDDLPPISIALHEWKAFAEKINNLILIDAEPLQ